jgi:hypothetical protein
VGPVQVERTVLHASASIASAGLGTGATADGLHATGSSLIRKLRGTPQATRTDRSLSLRLPPPTEDVLPNAFPDFLHANPMPFHAEPNTPTCASVICAEPRRTTDVSGKISALQASFQGATQSRAATERMGLKALADLSSRRLASENSAWENYFTSTGQAGNLRGCHSS